MTTGANPFSSGLQDKINGYLTRYETKRSAILPVLHAIQDELGWISDENVAALQQHYQLHQVEVKEVLTFYKEGLQSEIATLKEQIASAKTRKEGGDQQSLDKVSERDRLTAAEDELKTQLRVMEEDIASKFPLFPEPLRKNPKVTQGMEAIQKCLLLPADAQTELISKRLVTVTELMADVEKFQQGVHVFPELHKNSKGEEFNMQVVYFGLAFAYAANEDGSFALAGRANADGWKFQERSDLAPQILKLLVTATSETEVSFTNLPIIQP